MRLQKRTDKFVSVNGLHLLKIWSVPGVILIGELPNRNIPIICHPLKMNYYHLPLYSREVFRRTRGEDFPHLVVVNPRPATQHLPLVNSMWASVNGIIIRMHLVMWNALTCISIFWLCGNDTRTKESVIYKFPMYIIALLCLNIKSLFFIEVRRRIFIFLKAWLGHENVNEAS